MAWRNCCLPLPVLLAGMAGGAAQAADPSLTVTAQQDTSIYTGTAGSNTLADGSGDYLWLSVTAEGLLRRALLRFDLAALPAGSVVRQVTLTLYESRARDEHDVGVHRLLASWGEGASNAGGTGSGAAAAPGDATWLHRFYPGTPWASPGGDYDPVASAVQRVGFPNTTYSWAAALPASGSPVPRLVADVQGWVNAAASNHGWMLIGVESGLQNAKRFESRNNGTAVNRPKLTVVYTLPPDPGVDADIPLPPWALGLLAMLVGSKIVRSAHGRNRGSPAARHDRRQ